MERGGGVCGERASHSAPCVVKVKSGLAATVGSADPVESREDLTLCSGTVRAGRGVCPPCAGVVSERARGELRRVWGW